ncbi:MAG: hypothetical protein ACRDF7_04435 [Candidatus Limnocylindrales bacterium]
MRRWIALATAGILIIAFSAAADSATPPEPSALMSAADQVDLHIDLSGPPAETLGIDRATAVATAKSALGRQDEPSEIHQGAAAQYMNSPIRTVWIVVFAGGDPMNVGPAGNGDQKAYPSYSGVIIDGQTGDVLRSFIVAHPLP